MKKVATALLILATFSYLYGNQTIKIMQDTEIWKDVVGYEGYYQISNYGSIRSLPRNGTKKIVNTLKESGKLYPMIILQKNGVVKGYLIHRLVAIHFVDNPYSKPFVNHIDGNKSNYKFSNLEWCTHSENELHAHRTGLKNFKREKNPASKIDSEIAKNIIKEYSLGNVSQRFLAKKFRISQPLVNHIIKGKAWQ